MDLVRHYRPGVPFAVFAPAASPRRGVVRLRGTAAMGRRAPDMEV
jgi:hypothetical protein